ncbi:MAG: class I SAM-dependent methyltransferase [Acidiferrobacteraceae bacterium]
MTRDPFGVSGLTIVDRFGVWLSQRAISKHLPRRQDLDVLEIGCGFHARNLIALRSRTRHAVGVDFRVSDEAKQADRVQFIEGPIELVTADIGAASFDAVLLISILEHLGDPLAVLQGCHDWLRPHGVLLVNVPTWRGKAVLEFSAFRLGTSPRNEMDDHKMYYDKRDLWPLLVKAGFLPSRVHMRYHKCGLNLFAVAHKGVCESSS